MHRNTSQRAWYYEVTVFRYPGPSKYKLRNQCAKLKNIQPQKLDSTADYISVVEMLQAELPEEQWISSHAPASAHTGSTEQSHTAAGASLTEAAHTLWNTIIRITKKWEEKSRISFILKKPESKSSNFSVNIRKPFYPRKLRNVILFFRSYLQCIYAVFFCFCLVWKLTLMGLILSWAGHRKSSVRITEGVLLSAMTHGEPSEVTRLWCQLLGRGEPVQS